MRISVLDMIENIVGKRENAGYLYRQCFQKPSFSVPFNSLPNNKSLDESKLKAFTDDKIDVIEKLKFVLGRVENIVGKGTNAGYQHFHLYPQCFQKASFSESSKIAMAW